jgi:hypothetical protein
MFTKSRKLRLKIRNNIRNNVAQSSKVHSFKKYDWYANLARRQHENKFNKYYVESKSKKKPVKTPGYCKGSRKNNAATATSAKILQRTHKRRLKGKVRIVSNVSRNSNLFYEQFN